MAKSEKIRVAIADDHPLIVEGLVEKIQQREDMDVVGTYSDPDDLLSSYAKIKPTVVVMDLYFGENRTRGLTALQKLISKYRDARIVVYSQADQLTVIREAYRLGCLAYVTKDARMDLLWQAILSASTNDLFYTPTVARRFALEATVQTPIDALTDREREVFNLAAAGFKNPEIGEKLGITKGSAANLRAEVKKKLNLKSDSELTLLAIRLKLVEPLDS